MTEKGRYRLLRAANHRRMPWKNGLGVTTEMVVEPSGATLENFDWRLQYGSHRCGQGAFSSFPNIDRLLMVLEGRLHLAIEGRAPIELAADGESVKFPAELTQLNEVELAVLQVVLRNSVVDTRARRAIA